VEGDDNGHDDNDMSDMPHGPSNDSQELAVSQSPSPLPPRTNLGLQHSQPDSMHRALNIPHFFKEIKFPDKDKDKDSDTNKAMKKVCRLCMWADFSDRHSAF